MLLLIFDELEEAVDGFGFWNVAQKRLLAFVDRDFAVAFTDVAPVGVALEMSVVFSCHVSKGTKIVRHRFSSKRTFASGMGETT